MVMVCVMIWKSFAAQYLGDFSKVIKFFLMSECILTENP